MNGLPMDQGIGRPESLPPIYLTRILPSRQDEGSGSTIPRSGFISTVRCPWSIVRGKTKFNHQFGSEMSLIPTGICANAKIFVLRNGPRTTDNGHDPF